MRDRGEAWKSGLAPVVSPDARIVVLGSLPGDASLAAGRYYGHPRNQFWRLMEEVIDRPLDAMAYDERLAALGAAGVGLWDVIGAARRRNSLDSAIRDAAFNPLAEWLGRFPGLRAIAFNGKLAARAGRPMLDCGRWELLDLPSSSPANTCPLSDKARAWAALRAYLD